MGSAAAIVRRMDPGSSTAAVPGPTAAVIASAICCAVPRSGTRRINRSRLAKAGAAGFLLKDTPPEQLIEGNQMHMGDTVKFDAQVLNDRGEPIPDAKIKWRNSGWCATVAINGEVEGRAVCRGAPARGI